MNEHSRLRNILAELRRRASRGGDWASRRGAWAGPHVRRAGAWLAHVPWFQRVAGWLGSGDYRVGVGATAVALLVVVTAGATLLTGGSGSGHRVPLKPGTTPLQVIGYYENGWNKEFKDSLPVVRAHHRDLDEILAFWYSLGGQGRFTQDKSRPTVIRYAKRHHIRMGILVNNVKGKAGSNSALLTDPAARTRGIGNIVGVVKDKGYQAVDIDFELLPPKVRNDLTTFVCKLRDALPNGTELSVAVFPPVGVAHEINGAYDDQALADCTDYLVLMVYDYHYGGGPPGPISPNPWAAKNVDWLLQHGVKPDQIVVAAGLYGQDWLASGQGGSEEHSMAAVLNLAHAEGARVVYDKASGNPHFSYWDDRGRKHVVWFQDTETLKNRMKLAEAKHLRGVALWRLGYGTPAVWATIRDNLP